MRASGGNLLIMLLILAIGVFLGISFAADGVESVHGPFKADPHGPSAWLDDPAVGASSGTKVTSTDDVPHHPGTLDGSGGAKQRSTAAQPDTSAKQPAQQTARQPDGLPADYGNGLLDRAAEKTGDLLQITAEHGVKFIVSVFERALD